MALKKRLPHGRIAKSTESQMKQLFKRFLKDETGVTAIEYGLIAGLISVVIILTVTAIGTSLQGLFQTIANALAAA
jgi:pilus assembly protein Flp/PilA